MKFYNDIDIHPKLKLTVETLNDGKLPFLDIKVKQISKQLLKTCDLQESIEK